MAKAIKVRIAPAAGDPIKGKDNDMVLTSRSQGAIDLDIRDSLAELVGSGNVMSPEDKSSVYRSLTNSLGKDMATKVMNHAYIFNQRGDVQGLPIEDKLRTFYSIGSLDPDVNKVMSKTKALGYGVVPGFHTSSNAMNQVLAGRVSDGTETSVFVPEIKKRIAVRVKK